MAAPVGHVAGTFTALAAACRRRGRSIADLTDRFTRRLRRCGRSASVSGSCCPGRHRGCRSGGAEPRTRSTPCCSESRHVRVFLRLAELSCADLPSGLASSDCSLAADVRRPGDTLRLRPRSPGSAQGRKHQYMGKQWETILANESGPEAGVEGVVEDAKGRVKEAAGA